MAASKKKGIILMNLGSPDSCSVKDVRRYLVEFLMDERVIDQSALARTLLVKGIIAPFRAPKSAEAYRSIWTEDGSPLISITRQLRDALAPRVDMPVSIAMRYGQPDMKSGYEAILTLAPDTEEIILFPLYPQYAMSSYETAVEHAREVYHREGYKFDLKIIPPFYNNPQYIEALAESIRPNLAAGHLLVFSYHSIPERHILKGDITHGHCLKSADCCRVASPAHTFCYRHQCLETTRLVVQELGLTESQYTVAFQSKLGRSEWLKPSTTATMASLPGKGFKKISVVSPAFVSDCLETLEEVAIREKENFLHAGGIEYTFIPCLNTQIKWVDTIISLINK